MNYNEYLLKPYINNASDINTFLQEHSLEHLFNITNYKEIENFIKSKNKNIICLSKENLLDLGSLIPLI